MEILQMPREWDGNKIDIFAKDDENQREQSKKATRIQNSDSIFEINLVKAKDNLIQWIFRIQN